MEIYAAAVESAKAGVQATMHLPSLDPASQAAADTLALRLLNFALFYMRAEPPNMHVASNLLLEVSLRCGHNARTMATVAKYISLETAETKDVNILAALDGIITAGLKQLAANPLDFANTDILADLAVAHCDVGCNAIVPGSAQPTQFTKPENLAMWTLFNVATISPTTRTRLCLHAKAGSRDPALIHFIDSVGELSEANPKACGEIPAGNATKMWRDMTGGGSKPKAMMMVLDSVVLYGLWRAGREVSPQSMQGLSAYHPSRPHRPRRQGGPRHVCGRCQGGVPVNARRDRRRATRAQRWSQTCTA